MSKIKDEPSRIRSPIVSVLGHVDHGKSSILDSIRGTNILETEAGAITQAIGASIIPIKTIKKICGSMLNTLNMKFSIPGLLFIDTPGHAAFTSLRKRGGNLADIAILVVDINEGFKPQTKEAIEILRTYKTPFIVAANKIDLLPNYKIKEKELLKNINSQESQVLQTIETKLYELVGKFHEEFGINAERFDRVEDFRKQIAIVPCSAINNHGIAELLMVITGLAQKFLEKNLKIEVSESAKGTVLEIKDSKGLGTTIDVIIYDGTLKKNDIIVVGGVDKPLVTKVRALFQPAELSEMRDKKSKFKPCNFVVAATGVKIAAPDLNLAVPGMPLLVATQENLEEIKNKVMSEIGNTIINTEKEGIIIKADTLGSLEAMIKLFGEENIPIRKAGIGPISKKDIVDAESNYETDNMLAVILGFNIPNEKSTEKVKIITSDIIYKLLDDYNEWKDETKKKLEAIELNDLIRPCKIEILQNCLFRQSNPAIIGVEVLVGYLKKGTPLMKLDGTKLSSVKAIEKDKKNISVADKGLQIAISLPGVTCEKHINEFDILISDIPENDFKKLKNLKNHLSKEEVELLRFIAELKRKQNPVWGV